MNEQEYNNIFPVGTVIQPAVFCTNGFTMNMFEEQKKMALENNLNYLNKNDFGAVWEYKEGLGIVRIK